MTVRPLLPLALSCRYERIKPAKGHSVRLYMYVCKRLCKSNFGHVCVRIRGVLSKMCENYRSVSANLVWNNTEQLRIMWTIRSTLFGHAGTDHFIQQVTRAEREKERERRRLGEREGRGIMSSYNPPFDTTREALVSLNNPCCSIKFAD